MLRSGAAAARTVEGDYLMSRPAPNTIPIEDRLIVALDVESIDEAKAVVKSLGESVSFYKIGLGLQFKGGIELAKELKKQGKKVFFDSKIYDVEATTKAAVQSIVELGVDFLTIHGNTSILKEAVAGRGDSDLKLFVITVLTSLDDKDMIEMGYTVSVEKMVEYKTKAALDSRCDGVITSGLEARMIRRIAERNGSNLLIATPGIRSDGVSRNDQKRVATPKSAIEAGADYLVMGRQILKAQSRRDEAVRVFEDIHAALTT